MASPFPSASPLLVVCLLFALPATRGVEYLLSNEAEDTRGGELFDQIMGERKGKLAMEDACYFVWHRVFDQEDESEIKRVSRISLVIKEALVGDDAQFVERHLEGEYACEIQLDAFRVIERMVSSNFYVSTTVDSIMWEDEIKREINWRITSGVARALQWTGDGRIPRELRDGIAAFVVLEAHRTPFGWAKAGEGSRWDERADVTAQFLYYINRRRFQFVAKLNKMMRNSYSDDYFKEAAGSTVEEWWVRYKEDNRVK